MRRLKEAPCKSGNLAPQVADIFPLAYLFIFELSFCSRRFFDVYLRPTPYHKFLKLQPSVKAPRLSWRKVLFVFEFLSVSDCTFLPKTKMGEGGLSCSCSSASPSLPPPPFRLNDLLPADEPRLSFDTSNCLFGERVPIRSTPAYNSLG